MKLFLIIAGLIISMSSYAGTMTGTIQVSLTILPSPCITTSSEKSVTVDCGNLKRDVITVVEKQKSIEQENENYLVTISY